MPDQTTTPVAKKYDYWCVVALDETGNGWIIQRSEDARLRDVIPECCTEDNGVNSQWERENGPGLYRLQLRPTGGGPDMNGEYWSEVDVLSVTPLHALDVGKTNDV